MTQIASLGASDGTTWLISEETLHKSIELVGLGATSQAELVRSGEVSATELVTAHLDRIDALSRLARAWLGSGMDCSGIFRLRRLLSSRSTMAVT